MRPSKDEVFVQMAVLMSRRSTCHRLAVGCVLTNARGHVLSTGYNGRAAGLPHCNEESMVLGAPIENPNPFWREQSGVGTVQPWVETFPHRCPNSGAPSGKPNGCESIHAEQNALLQCVDVYEISTCFVTHSPCLVCVKLLMNTSCQRIVYREEYPQAGAKELWESTGRVWFRLAS